MRLLKRGIYLLVGLVGLLVAASFIATCVVHPNDYKDKLIAVVHERTGRDLVIHGDIAWSFFPWLGVRIQKAQLSNALDFVPQDCFARVGEVNLKVKLLPLLSRQVEIGQITLKKLELNLAKNKQGVGNWQDLSRPATDATVPESQAKKSSDRSFLLSVRGVNVEDAHIVWVDAQQERTLTLSNLQMKSEDLALGHAFPFFLAFDMESNKPAVAGHFAVKGTVLADLNKATYQLSGLQASFDFNQKNQAVTLQAEQVLADLYAQTLVVEKGLIAKGDLKARWDLRGEQILANPLFNGHLQTTTFNLKNLLATLGKPLLTAGPTALQKVAFNGQFEVIGSAIHLKPLTISLDGSTVAGALTIVNGEAASLQFDLAVDQFNLDNYLPPAAPAQQKVSSSTGERMALLDAQSATADALPDILRTASVNGSLRIATFISVHQVLRQMYAQVALNQGLLQINPFSAGIYGGSARGKLSMDFRKPMPAYAIDATLSGIDMAQLIESERIIGKANLNSQLTFSGREKQAMLQSLTGKVKFDAQNGALVGANIPYEVKRVLALLKRQAPPPITRQNQTDFAVLKGSGTFTRGVFNNQDLMLQSSEFKITGSGSADLVTERLNYHVQMAGLRPGLDEPARGSQMYLPISILGTFNKPVIQPDVRAFLQSEQGAAVLKRARERLESQVGPGAGQVVGRALRRFLQP